MISLRPLLKADCQVPNLRPYFESVRPYFCNDALMSDCNTERAGAMWPPHGLFGSASPNLAGFRLEYLSLRSQRSWSWCRRTAWCG